MQSGSNAATASHFFQLLAWLLPAAVLVTKLCRAPIHGAPGPFVSPPDLAFGVSDDMRIAQALLPESKSLPYVPPQGSNTATILPEKGVGSRGTEAGRLVRELMMAVSPFVNTEEILIDQAARDLHGLVVNSAKQGVFDGTDDVTVHSAALLDQDAVTRYSKAVLLLGDGQRRLLACVAHIVGAHVTLSNVAILAARVPLMDDGRVAGASITSISSQHVALSYSTPEQPDGKAGTHVHLYSVHPKTDAIDLQHSSEIVPAASSDTCVLATTERLLVASVSLTSPPFGVAWLASLRMQRLSQDIDSEVMGSLSILQRPAPSSINWQVGDIQPGTLDCQSFNETGLLAALVTFRTQRPTHDCGAFPAPAHATVTPSGRVRRGQGVNVSCNAGYRPAQGENMSEGEGVMCREGRVDENMRGVADDWVLASGMFERAAACVPVSCGPYNLPAHSIARVSSWQGSAAMVTYVSQPQPDGGGGSTGNVSYGEEVLLACRAGYVLSEAGSASPGCLADGSFAQGKICEREVLRSGHCGAAPPVRFATVSPPGRIFVGQAVQSIKCNAGYQPADPALFDRHHMPKCVSSLGSDQVDGTFEETADMQGYAGSTPVSQPRAQFSHAFAGVCVPRSCGRFTPPAHSTVSPNGTVLFGEHATIRCNAGFVHSTRGRSTPRCIAHGDEGGGRGGVAFEQGSSCVPGGGASVVLRQLASDRNPAQLSLARIGSGNHTQLVSRGVLALTSVRVWPWQTRDRFGVWRASRKCTRMPGYITCLSAPPAVGARGDCPLPVNPVPSDDAPPPLSPGSVLTGATCSRLGTRCTGDCSAVRDQVPVDAVFALVLQADTGTLHLWLATVSVLLPAACLGATGAGGEGEDGGQRERLSLAMGTHTIVSRDASRVGQASVAQVRGCLVCVCVCARARE